MAQTDNVNKNGEITAIEEKSKKSPSIIARLKDPHYRRKLLEWTRIPIADFTVGLNDSQAAATFLDLQIITSTNTEMASLFFIAGNLGYLVGSVLAGYIFGKVNSNMTLFTATILAGIGTIVLPYCTSFAPMFVDRCIIGVFLGMTFCMTTADHMVMWGTQGQALYQLVNCLYACGGVVGPLIASPFVADKDSDNVTSLILNKTADIFLNGSGAENSTLPRTTNVHYAFLITGILVLVASIPFLIVFVLSRISPAQEESKEAHESLDRKLPRALYLFLVAMVFGLFLTYACVELTFSSFIMTFAVRQYPAVTKQMGTYLVSYFWAALLGARFLSFFTSKYLSAIRLLYVHLSLMVAAFIGFLVSAVYARIDTLTAFTCLVGVACSAILPAAVSWIEDEIMKVTGPISAVILIGVNTGAMITPYIVGYLMENESNMWFCYSTMIAVALSLSFFVFLHCFNRCCVNKRYGRMGESQPSAEPQKPVSGTGTDLFSGTLTKSHPVLIDYKSKP